MCKTPVYESTLARKFVMKLEGKCPFCEKAVKADEFRDELSRKEFKISGLCQSCQDEIFK